MSKQPTTNNQLKLSQHTMFGLSGILALAREAKQIGKTIGEVKHIGQQTGGVVKHLGKH
jgi:hypothetical protein